MRDDDPLRLTGVQPLDPQDPLPEASWGWRRLIVFVTVALLFAGLGWSLFRLQADDVLAFAHGLMVLLGLVLVLYLIAPSATQLAELLAALKLRMGRPRGDAGEPGSSGREGPIHEGRGRDGRSRGWRAPWEDVQ